MTQSVIDQKGALTIGFGEVLRSSAIFYVRQSETFRTTITFMNYWHEKRGLDVAIVASTRTMEGRLIGRERLRFEDGRVVNYVPNLAAGGVGEGSIEIEVFSTECLFIPYPAIIAVYQTPSGISAVHSYARAYSRHEIEEGKTIATGAESNWTLRDSDRIRSFAVMHNGAAEQPAQMVELVVRAIDGRRRDAKIALPAIAAFGSIVIRPADHIDGIAEFFGGETGQATLFFQLNQAFTRMLVGNEAIDGDDFQITHSDLNFAVHATDHVEHDGAQGCLRIPRLGGIERWLVVYPGQDPGDYVVGNDETAIHFKSGEPLVLAARPGHQRFVFSRSDARLPTRINVGIGCRASKVLLPAEPSLGIVHAQIPTKRMTWGPCIVGDGVGTRLVVHAHDETFGPFPSDETVCLRLYSSRRFDHLEQVLVADRLDELDDGMAIEDIFPEARSFLGGAFGYFTLFSEYGGLKAYFMIERDTGSLTLEHCF